MIYNTVRSVEFGLKFISMSIFKELKVMELASVLAGPSVGQFFAELGATVIKVENPLTGGDVTRSWKAAQEQTDERSAYFCSVNWGKQSISVDLLTPAGKEKIHALIPSCDVVLVSYKPGDAEKLGMDYKTLSGLNSRLIYGSITGYGAHNLRVGYDAVIQAEAGFMFMNGSPGGNSLKMPVALMDVLAGHQLKEGILLALLNREKTGKGDCVEVSLIQAGVASLVNQATNWLVAGKLPTKQGSAHPNIAPYGDVFITADRQELLLAVGSDRQFFDLCSILKLEALSKDERFKTNAARVRNREVMNESLCKAIAMFSATSLIEKINQLKIPAALINNMEQVFEIPEAKELLLEGDGLKGVRTYVGKHQYKFTQDVLSSPPSLKK